MPGPCYCYIVECADGTLYTGWAVDPERRVAVHNKGRGAPYTRIRLPVKLVYLEEQPDRTQMTSRLYLTGLVIAAAMATLVARQAGAEPLSFGSLRPSVLEKALSAAACAQRAGAVIKTETLTVIDYSLPSTAKRLWVIDLPRRRLLFEELVSHGRGSGEAKATKFSNTPIQPVEPRSFCHRRNVYRRKRLLTAARWP